jgi:hypothetical protein
MAWYPKGGTVRVLLIGCCTLKVLPVCCGTAELLLIGCCIIKVLWYCTIKVVYH